MTNSEIIITPTGSKNLVEDINEDQKSVHFSVIEEKLNTPATNPQASDKFLNDDLSEYRSVDNRVDQSNNDPNTKLTIRGPGNYIKKLIQQFSEGPFETEDSKPEPERATSGQTIKDKADAICKKCLHYKGKISK